MILPLIIFLVIVATQFVMMLISSAALLPSGLAGTTWTNFNLFQQSLILLYSLIVIALWHAPIYGWALLISGWARRATFLWAVLPFLAIGILEKACVRHFALCVDAEKSPGRRRRRSFRLPTASRRLN